ncbi:arylsulfotransferase family protein [Mariprofundus ferrooxydans]|uniref:Arylsulfotransferase N-terminal domain-containing protein n=1 Tax=Mariprofundus ferrooxydans PV-1 TaxID=314345 RepID=Q0EZB7_9PROT|nr:arylsulfotransferase family protein [Mariprofundus ferrooxydans]EAU54507.1 hypothetical protein SPV1_07426 [Mariprofundus ferrooxydans PV-1]
MKLESFMMRKVPLWVLLLLVLFALCSTVLFGWYVKRALQQDARLESYGSAIVAIADFPSQMKRTFDELKEKKSPLLLINRFPEIDNFNENGEMQQGAATDKGYLLLSVYDQNKGQSVVKLVRISDNYVVHEWVPSIEELKTHIHYDPNNNVQPLRYRIMHPLLLDDGSIVFKMEGPLVKVDACSRIKWVTNGVFHHSIEQDSSGNLWVPSVIEPSTYDMDKLGRYRDDAITQVSLNGKVLFRKSVSRILEENGYVGLLFGVSLYEDMIHLNDIQPALYTTQYWKEGDLLISLRHRSTVFLYRPSSNKIIWLKTGPWLNQHDVNFVGQSEISVFNNNVLRSKRGGDIEVGNNNIMIFDFADGHVSTPYNKPLDSLKVHTSTEGRGEILDNGDVFIEETNYGRILRASKDKVVWQFASKVNDKFVSMTHWSRYLTKEQVRNVIPVLEGSTCP